MREGKAWTGSSKMVPSVSKTIEPPKKTEPKGEVYHFNVLQHYGDSVQIKIVGSELEIPEYKIRENLFIAAVLKFGYVANSTNKWPFIMNSENRYLNIDWEYWKK